MNLKTCENAFIKYIHFIESEQNKKSYLLLLLTVNRRSKDVFVVQPLSFVIYAMSVLILLPIVAVIVTFVQSFTFFSKIMKSVEIEEEEEYRNSDAACVV